MPRVPTPADFAVGTPAPRPGRTPSRVLWGFDARAARLVDAVGVAGTFARAGAAMTVDRTGALRLVSAGQPRWYACDLDGDGVRESLGLLLEGSATNVCLGSTPNGVDWNVGTGATLTTGARRCGDVTLSRILGASGDRRDVGAETTGIGASGPKGISLLIAADAVADPAGSQYVLYDSTDGVNRWDVTVTWVGGVPIVAAATGFALGVEPLSGGVWRLYGQTSSVTGTHSHVLHLYPNAGAATGACVVGGVQVDQGPFPTSLIPTFGSSATRAAESLTWPVAWLPQDCTLYAALAWPVWAGRAGAEHAPLLLGTPGSGGSTRLTDLGDGVLGAYRYDGGDAVPGALAAPTVVRGPHRERLDWGAQLAGWRDRSVPPTLTMLASTGSATTAEPASAIPAAAWTAPTVALAAAAREPNAVVLAATIAPGLRTLDELRGLR